MEAIVNTFIIIVLVVNIIISIYMLKTLDKDREYEETTRNSSLTKNIYLKDKDGNYIKNNLGELVIDRVETNESNIYEKSEALK